MKQEYVFFWRLPIAGAACFGLSYRYMYVPICLKLLTPPGSCDLPVRALLGMFGRLASLVTFSVLSAL